MTKHQDRRIVITGVSHGLGRAMVDGFISQGHTVFGCARSRGPIRHLAGRYPSPHRFAVVDVRDARQVARWAQRLVSAAGPPDLLINNAAVINRNAALWEVPAKEFSDVIDANIKGVYHVIRGFVPAMVRKRHGVIVNFSSGWGRSTSPEVAPYCASKWAVEGLTRALAEELPRGMAAVPLNPGIIRTRMLESCFGDDAFAYPVASAWARRAIPFILRLGAKDNGHPLTIPS